MRASPRKKEHLQVFTGWRCLWAVCPWSLGRGWEFAVRWIKDMVLVMSYGTFYVLRGSWIGMLVLCLSCWAYR
jgi:hypothetical protein